MAKLPKAECKYGYPESQTRAVVGDRYTEFMRWMRGQTVSLCDGREYDHGKKEYVATGCGPHGTVVYSWDVKRFLEGRPIID